MKIKNLLVLLILFTFVSCAPRFDKQVNYISRIFIGEINENKNRIDENSKAKANICFTVNKFESYCFENIKSGQVLNLKSDSKTISLKSIDIIEDKKKYQYEFNKIKEEPLVELNSYSEAVYLGRILLNVVANENEEQPELSLASGCDSIKQDTNFFVKAAALPSNILTKCFELSASVGKGKNSFSILLVMPPK